MVGFKSPRKPLGASCSWLARQDRPDGLRTRQEPIAGRKSGKDGTAVSGAGKPPGLRRVCGLLRPAGRGAGQNRRPVEARRLAYARQQGRRLGYMAGTRPRHGLAPAGVHHGRAAGSDPQPGASLRRPPAPLTAATTLSRFLASRSWAPDVSGARQGGPFVPRAQDGNAGIERHRPNARWSAR